MTERPYQADCLNGIAEAFKESRSALVVMPTGAGKTVVAAKAMGTMNRAMFLAHRRDLVRQAAATIGKVTGVAPGVEMAEDRSSGVDRFLVASNPSMLARHREFRSNDWQLLVQDEAHHAAAPSFQTVLNYFQESKLLGFTATPNRSDKKSLASVFERIAYEVKLFDLVDQGYLCPISVQCSPVTIDLSEVKTSRTNAGQDFQQEDLGKALDPHLDRIVQELRGIVEKRRSTVVFLPLVATSERFVYLCRTQGIKAAHVDGTMNEAERQQAFTAFRSGMISVLSNAMLLTEGWDMPPVDCVVNLRPTKSTALLMQMVGRGTRLSPDTGKQNLLVVDFLYQYDGNGLVRPAALVAETDEQADAITKALSGGAEMDLRETATSVEVQREMALRKRLEESAQKKAKTFDPAQLAVLFKRLDIADYEPVFAWEQKDPSQAQLDLLRKWGVNPVMITTRGMASKIIDANMARRRAGKSTLNQIKILRRYGRTNPEDLTFQEASSVIDAISKREGWRRAPQAVVA